MVANHSGASKTPTKTRVAVVGTGSIGMRHLEVLRKLGDKVPIAVPRRPERIVQLEDAGYCTSISLDEAVQMGATCCIIATETGAHLRDGLTGFDLGLDLLVEKPLATDAKEAAQLQARAEECHLSLYVACVLRFSQSLNIFRNRLDEVGRLHSVRIECQSYLPDWQPARPYLETFRARPREGGVLLDLIHEVDYAGWLFGWPSSVQARIRNLGILGIDADEAAELWWETEPGCAVSIRLDFLTKPDRRRITACGSRGTMEWNGIEGTVTINLTGVPSQQITTAQAPNDMLVGQSSAFLNATNGGRDPRLATGKEGITALEICDAARRSSAENREAVVAFS